MSVPILKTNDYVKVLSFEPSPNSWPYLLKTWSGSPWKDRWKIVRKAVGDRVGQAQFFRSVERYAGYDGLRNTERAPASGCETVLMTTLDEEWNALGRPLVSCLKVDAEGAEMCILAGAREMIRETQPYVFLEWYEKNFRHFGSAANDLLEIAGDVGYEVVAIPQLGEIHSLPVLLLHMQVTASFVLVPRAGSRASSRAAPEFTAVKH
jgi:FkbM family methyltransferase